MSSIAAVELLIAKGRSQAEAGRQRGRAGIRTRHTNGAAGSHSRPASSTTSTKNA